MKPAIKIVAFAGARDIIGEFETSLGLERLVEGCTARDVMDALCSKHPDLVGYRPIIRLAVNGCYVAESEPVSAGDEVALIPPVAGG